MVEEILTKEGFSLFNIKSLLDFIPRDGFMLLSNEECNKMFSFLQLQEDELKEIFPILTDENSNYICVFIKGINRKKVCYLSHDEVNLNPIFKNITNLISAINNNPDAWDITELPKIAFDYPTWW